MEGTGPALHRRAKGGLCPHSTKTFQVETHGCSTHALGTHSLDELITYSFRSQGRLLPCTLNADRLHGCHVVAAEGSCPPRDGSSCPPVTAAPGSATGTSGSGEHSPRASRGRVRTQGSLVQSGLSADTPRRPGPGATACQVDLPGGRAHGGRGRRAGYHPSGAALVETQPALHASPGHGALPLLLL